MYYIVYGISDCPSCLRACADLMEQGCQYVFVNCDFSKDYREEIKSRLIWPTFPIIIEHSGEQNNLIGGQDQLKGRLSHF